MFSIALMFDIYFVINKRQKLAQLEKIKAEERDCILRIVYRESMGGVNR